MNEFKGYTAPDLRAYRSVLLVLWNGTSGFPQSLRYFRNTMARRPNPSAS